jgi:hypothetical protein
MLDELMAALRSALCRFVEKSGWNLVSGRPRNAGVNRLSRRLAVLLFPGGGCCFSRKPE